MKRNDFVLYYVLSKHCIDQNCDYMTMYYNASKLRSHANYRRFTIIVCKTLQSGELEASKPICLHVRKSVLNGWHTTFNRCLLYTLHVWQYRSISTADSCKETSALKEFLEYIIVVVVIIISPMHMYIVYCKYDIIISMSFTNIVYCRNEHG